MKIVISSHAIMDIKSIYKYINDNDSKTQEDYVIQNIRDIVNSLSDLPLRGNYVNELLKLGIKEYREIYFKKYRVIYSIDEDTVYCHLIADGRRNFIKLLEIRLLQG